MQYSLAVPDPEEPKTAAVTSRAAVVATLALAGAVLVMALVLQCSGDDAPAGGPVSEGMVAPDFELVSLDGERVALSDFAGRPVMINFWASWCPPCRDEFPVLAEARAEHLDAGFEILGVTRNDGEEYSRRFVEDSGAAWPMLPDTDSVAWRAYGAIGLPTSYFVDAEGIVQRFHIGPLNYDQLANHLAAIGLGAQVGEGGGDTT